MAKNPPAFQFYASDFLASVSVMTLDEVGAHIKLMAWSWEHGPIPNEIKRIAAILGVSRGTAKYVFNTICSRWSQDDQGCWYNPRLEQVRGQQAEYAARQSAKGKAGAVAKRQAQAQAQVVAQGDFGQTKTGQNGQPKTSSPISDLHTPDPLSRERSEEHTPRVSPPAPLIDGRAIRQHGSHAWCSLPREGLCVPPVLHRELMGRALMSDGEIRAWYTATVAKFDGVRVGEDAFTFWRNEVAALVGMATQKPAPPRAARTAAEITMETWRNG